MPVTHKVREKLTRNKLFWFGDELIYLREAMQKHSKHRQVSYFSKVHDTRIILLRC